MAINATICTAYLREGGQKLVSTTPGRTIAFIGGCARVKVGAEDDIPTLLRMGNVTLEFEPGWEDFVPAWIERCGEFRPAVAKINMPPGTHLVHGNDAYVVKKDAAPVVPLTEEEYTVLAAAWMDDDVEEPEEPDDEPYDSAEELIADLHRASAPADVPNSWLGDDHPLDVPVYRRLDVPLISEGMPDTEVPSKIPARRRSKRPARVA